MFALSRSRSAVAPLLLGLLLLSGTTVSTLYWAQAMTGLIRSDLGSAAVGLMPSATLAGYAVGVALLASVARDLSTANGLGLHALLLGAGLSAASVAPTASALVAACVAIGMGCSLTQRVLACATSAVSPAQRSPVIGAVVASGLAGIVLARGVVPVLSVSLGWRTMFILDAAAICTVGLSAAIAAQRVDGRHPEADATPLPGAWALWRLHPALRQAALRQACVFAAFNAAWAVFPRTVVQTSGAAGGPALSMGAVAAFGAVSALSAGMFCRRIGPERIARLGVAAVLLALAGSCWASGAGALTFAVMALLEWGTQTGLVANQSHAQAQATSRAMRGRITAIVTTVGFAAGAAGAALGNAWP